MFCHYMMRFDGYVLCYHLDVLRSSLMVCCVYILCGEVVYDVSSFSLY